MPKPLSLDEVANEMRDRQNNPTSNASAQTVWDPDRGVFVQLAPGEKLGSNQTPLNTLAKEPYFYDQMAENEPSGSFFYIDGEELKSYIDSGCMQVNGFGYEWEDENVIHLHFSPIKHSFGIVHKVSFAADGMDHDNSADLLVDVISETEVRVNGVLVSIIPSKNNIYKRAKGLLEVGTLSNKRVLIIGLGSGGAPVAIELAKAGIGHFVLVDFDRVELHNLSRHICTVNDLGRLKIDAVADAILGKNPYANVIKYPLDVNDNIDIIDQEIKNADIVMICTDNNISRYRISELLVKNNTIGVFGRAVTRAEGGDVFIYRPGQACYFCLLGTDWFNPEDEEITDFEAAKRSGQIPAYVSLEDAAAFVQVGLSSDIEPITNMMVKLALVELSRGTDSGVNCLENELKQNYFMWANRRERQYGMWGSFTNTDRMPTILKWYGVDIAHNNSCNLCGEHSTLIVETHETKILNEKMGNLANVCTPDVDLTSFN